MIGLDTHDKLIVVNILVHPSNIYEDNKLYNCANIYLQSHGELVMGNWRIPSGHEVDSLTSYYLQVVRSSIASGLILDIP